MSKSVYSLLLNDEVVDLIDKMARINGMSRSNMVEKILADAVTYETPEIRANTVFSEIERILSGSPTMRYLEQPSSYMASIMSALSYRYNPAIRYSVELFPHSSHLGQLKVTLRTQNPILIEHMSDFYSLYTLLEKKYYNDKARHIYDGAKFTRLFTFPSVAVTTKELASILTSFVRDFDELLSIYFSNLTNPNGFSVVEKRFIELKRNKIII
ncbi:MAG: hypothetical protein J6V66_05270 [Clostridia bacterium]|nr:hypothetical protein [Clostridia bacterium]